MCAHDMPPPLMLGHNNIIFKHIPEPAESARPEEVSNAIGQSDRVTGADEGERKSGMSSQVILVAPVKTGQLVSEGVPAATPSANVVDGRKAAGIGVGAACQEIVDSFDLCSDRMTFIGDVRERKVKSAAHTYEPSSLERGQVVMGRVASLSPGTNVGDGANCGQDAPAAERKDARVGVAEDASARKDIMVLTLAIRPPSRSPTAPPVDVIPGQDSTVGPAIKVVASGEVSAVDQETDLQSPRVPSGKHVPSPALQGNPSTSGDINGERDLYDLGVATALETGSNKLLSEVARYFGQEAKRAQRPRRRARQGNAPAPPVKFSLRLSEQEAMEDVAAVTLAKDVKLEDEMMPARRNAKRRRH
ncbi:hypothetical protein ZWY2020_057031 [Hordeum vulgare]|nr:hypothetical protein ZWY2020_057031 [Hordeum vulgare]